MCLFLLLQELLLVDTRGWNRLNGFILNGLYYVYRFPHLRNLDEEVFCQKIHCLTRVEATSC